MSGSSNEWWVSRLRHTGREQDTFRAICLRGFMVTDGRVHEGQVVLQSSSSLGGSQHLAKKSTSRHEANAPKETKTPEKR